MKLEHIDIEVRIKQPWWKRKQTLPSQIVQLRSDGTTVTATINAVVPMPPSDS